MASLGWFGEWGESLAWDMELDLQPKVLGQHKCCVDWRFGAWGLCAVLVDLSVLIQAGADLCLAELGLQEAACIPLQTSG